MPAFFLSFPPSPSLSFSFYLLEADGVRNVAQVRRGRQRVLGKAAVHRIARVVLRRAQRLVAREAELAHAAARMQPRDAHPVPDLDRRHAGTHRHHDAGPFVPRDERQLGGCGPVAVHSVHVRMAHTAGDNHDERLPGARLLHGDVADVEAVAVVVAHARQHGGGDGGHAASKKKAALEPTNGLGDWVREVAGRLLSAGVCVWRCPRHHNTAAGQAVRRLCAGMHGCECGFPSPEEQITGGVRARRRPVSPGQKEKELHAG